MDRLSPGLSLETAAALSNARLLRGDAGRQIFRLASLTSAGPEDLSFFADSRYAGQAQRSRAGAVIVREADAATLPPDCALLVCDDPSRAFAALAREVTTRLRPAELPGIHPTAIVDPEARIGDGVSIGPRAVIGAGAWIGAGAMIGAAAVLGARVTVGASTRLYPGAIVYDGCTIGARCIVHSGAVIGADGFGFAAAGAAWEKIPQLGSVVIGDDVEIGANTTIDRGALDDTVIGDGCKLDNQIQIAHNVRIGEGSALAGCVGVAGSAVIGRRCRIGGGAGIVGHIEICDDVTVSAMTFVTRSIRRPGFYTGVFPLMENAAWERAAAVLRRLPDLRARLRRLEQPRSG